MHFPVQKWSPTSRSDPSRKHQNPLRRETRASCSYTAWNSTQSVFPHRNTATNDIKSFPRNRYTLRVSPRRPSVALPVALYCRWHCCQSGRRPHENLAHAIGAWAPIPLIWLANAAVSHTSAREPESPVGSAYLSPHLTFDINILPIFELQTDYSPCVWSRFPSKMTGESNKGVFHLKCVCSYVYNKLYISH